jgi:hypothetical protein
LQHGERERDVTAASVGSVRDGLIPAAYIGGHGVVELFFGVCKLDTDGLDLASAEQRSAL